MIDQLVSTVSWGEFATEQPELARFGIERFDAAPAYLATIRKSGAPRVHPVTPIVHEGGLYLFMEATSPKGRDIRERGWFAIHNGVADHDGTGGEFFTGGLGFAVDDPDLRVAVAATASYDPRDDYVLFDLRPSWARCNGYGDVALPATTRWSVDP